MGDLSCPMVSSRPQAPLREDPIGFIGRDPDAELMDMGLSEEDARQLKEMDMSSDDDEKEPAEERPPARLGWHHDDAQSEPHVTRRGSWIDRELDQRGWNGHVAVGFTPTAATKDWSDCELKHAQMSRPVARRGTRNGADWSSVDALGPLDLPETPHEPEGIIGDGKTTALNTAGPKKSWSREAVQDFLDGDVDALRDLMRQEARIRARIAQGESCNLCNGSWDEIS